MLIFLWLLLVVAAIVWMTVRVNLHPFLAPLFGSIVMEFLTRLADRLSRHLGGDQIF